LPEAAAVVVPPVTEVVVGVPEPLEALEVVEEAVFEVVEVVVFVVPAAVVVAVPGRHWE
jgi:hypothetical protein